MMFLNHSRAELKKFSKSKLVSIGTQILKRFPKRALPGTIYVMEQSAKRYGIKSIGKIAKRVKRKAKSGAKKIKRKVKRRSGKRFKTAYSRFPKRYSNGRTIKKSKMPRRLIKGTPEAKRYMAKIRAMR
jgi:hypothetical protein